MYRRLEIYKFLINEGAKIDASWTHCDVMAYGLGTELDPAPEDEAAQLLDAMQGQPWDRDFEYLVGFLWVGLYTNKLIKSKLQTDFSRWGRTISGDTHKTISAWFPRRYHRFP